MLLKKEISEVDMAELHVQKKGKPIWPWIVVIIVVFLLVWLIGEGLKGRTEEKQQEESSMMLQDIEETGGINGKKEVDTPIMLNNDVDSRAELHEFIEYVRLTNSLDSENQSLVYYGEGLRQLADALEAIVELKGVDIDDIAIRSVSIRKIADHIEDQKNIGSGADSLRVAFDRAAFVMEKVQQQYYPNLEDEVHQVRKAADDLKSDELVTMQSIRIKAFFNKSSEALKAFLRNNGRG